MAEYRAATAYTSILPSLRGFVARLRKDLKKEMAKIGDLEVPVTPDVDWKPVKRQAPKQGAEAGGAFARAFKTRVEAALRSLPDIKIDADTSEAATEIAGLRTRLEALRDLRIGVDIDAGEAQAEIQAISQQLRRLSAETADPQVRLDTAAAASQLAAFQSQMDRLDGRDVDVRVDVDRSGDGLRSAIFLSRSINGIVLAGAAIGPALIPGIAAAAVAMGGLASAAAAAAAGVGGFVVAVLPGIANVTKAIQAQTAADKAGATQSARGASTRIQSAYAAQQAAKRVADAQREADRTAEEGARRVARAREQVVLAHERAAEQIEAAQRRVADAEADLTRAQQDQKAAQEALTQARKDALLALEDLRERTRDLALDEESAEIALIEARQRQAEVEKDANATALERRKAALAVAEAENRLKDVRREQGRTTTELNDAERKGVDGSGRVVSAQQRLQDAVAQVARASRDNRDAQRELAKVQRDAARNIRDAETDLSLARQEAARANQDAARRVAEALAAQAHQADLANAGAGGSVAAMANLQYAMGQLTPWQKRLYDGFVQLRTSFTDWSKSLEPDTIPVLLKGMQLIQKFLPYLTPIVKATARAFSDLLDKASNALNDPFWKGFFDFLAKTAGPSIRAFGEILGNIATGFAGILMAFAPVSRDLTQGLVNLSRRFAEWGKSLADNPSFKAFIAYVRELWPDLRAFFSALFKAIGNVVKAFAPLAGPILTALTGIATVIAALPPDLLVAIGGAILGVAAATKIWAVVVALLNRTMKANIILLVAAAVAALIVWLVRAYKTNETFRRIVDAAFKAVGAVVRWVWDHILKPTFEGLKIVIGVVAKAVSWFYNNVFKPYWTAVGIAAKWVWEHLLKPYFNFINAGIRTLVTVVKWWYNSIFKPVWTAIGTVVRWVWNTFLRPQFEGFKRGIRQLADVAKWLYYNVIKPVWDKIGSAIKWVWKNIIEPQIKGFKTAIRTLGDSFEAARKAIKTAWDKIKGIAAAPINFVIREVYNKGIRVTWNTLADAVGLDLKLKPAKEVKLASGGVLPGYRPGVDSIPAILSPGEGILRPEVVRSLGPSTIHEWNAAAMAGRPIERHATGGIAGAAASVAGFFSNAGKWVRDQILAPVKDKLRKITDNDWGRLISRLPLKLVDGLAKKAKDLVSGVFGGAGGSPLGKGAAFAQRTAQRMMPYFGWPGVGPMWDALRRLWHGESGWRASAHNPSSGAHGIPQCVDLSTRILTRRGWLAHNEVRPGDETIGYNPATGNSEWTRVLEVLHPGQATLYRVGISRWSARSTANHRWLMERMVEDKPAGEEMVELRHHRGRKHRIVTARPAETPGNLPISTEEAALLGWIAADGWVIKARPQRRQAETYAVVQVRTKRWKFFEALREKFPALAVSRERNGVRELRMSTPYARDLTARAGGSPKTAAVEQVLAMSTEQRAAWLGAMIAADGHVGGRVSDFTQISQKEGPIAEAVKLAIYLSGQNPSVYKDERYDNTVLTIGLTSPFIGMRLARVEEDGYADVWCVRTGLGTWTAEQGGLPFLTGNSLPGRKMASEGADWYTNPVTQIRWGLKYIRGRYGNPINAYRKWLARSPHWYDNGGYLMPGANVAMNGTRRPEPVLTAAQWDTMRTIAQRAAGGGDINIHPKYALLDEKRLAQTLYATRLRERADRPI